MKNIAIFIGTRPDTLKFIPIIKKLKYFNISFKLIVSGQHTTLIKKVLDEFAISPDYIFRIKRNNLNEFSGKLFLNITQLFQKESFYLTLVQGDTTTATIAAIASYYENIPVYHIEAGLRSGDLFNPFPEEGNRKIIGQIASFHFAPSKNAIKNLQKEGIQKNKILFTGNTIIDLVRDISKTVPRKYKNILITIHRRESWGKELEEMCIALKYLSNKYINFNFIFPIHPNPILKSKIENILKNSKVKLIKPLNYKKLIFTLKQSKLVISDSGGIQEEAGFLGIPIVIVRKKTERPELIKKGVGILTGTDKNKIITTVENILNNSDVYSNMNGNKVLSYGKGNAADIIVNFIKKIH